MIFSKFTSQTLALLVILLLVNQPVFADTQSLKDALDTLNKSVDDGLSMDVGRNDTKPNARTRIGIKGITYKGKHTQLSQTVESSLGEYFTKNRNFAVFNRSQMTSGSQTTAVKDELLMQRGFDFSEDDAIPAGQFSPVDVLIMGTIREKDGDIVIKVVSKKVKNNEELSSKSVFIEYLSWWDNYLELSNEQKIINEDIQREENERQKKQEIADEKRERDKKAEDEKRQRDQKIEDEKRERDKEAEDEKRQIEKSDRLRDRINALSERRNKKKKSNKCNRECKRKGNDGYKCNQLCGI